MMLLAYCDASTKGKRAVATTLIMTETTFITCFSVTYEDVDSSTHAELLSVLQTVRYIREKCSNARRIVLFNDNLSVVLQFINALANWDVPPGVNNPEIFEKLLEYSKGMSISVQHIHGHQHTHNPNKVCDTLSRLKFELEENRCSMG